MAQQVIYNPGYCAQFYPNANCQNLGPGNPYTGGYQQRAAYQQNCWNGGWNNSYNRWDTGNPYTRDYQRVPPTSRHLERGWNNSYNRWDNGNPYTRAYQRTAAYQPAERRLEQQLQPLGRRLAYRRGAARAALVSRRAIGTPSPSQPPPLRPTTTATAVAITASPMPSGAG